VSTIEELEQRIAALEARLDQGDDLGNTVKATHRVVQAVHLTQSDHDRRLTGMEQKLDEITGVLGSQTLVLDQIARTLGRLADGDRS
jgi:uncharacterized coiled-coil protein SlyX